MQICHEVAQALLAVAGDACCVLRWSCGAAPAVATFELAHTLMQWTDELYTANPGMSKSTITMSQQLMAKLGYSTQQVFPWRQ